MNLLVRTCNYERMNVQRIIARGVVLLGIVVTGAAVFGGLNQMGYSTAGTPLQYATTAAIPFGVAIVVFVIGLYFELLAAVLLVLGALAMGVWGLMNGWEYGTWMIMLSLIIGPMVFAGALYWLAAQTQNVCELQESTSKA